MPTVEPDPDHAGVRKMHHLSQDPSNSTDTVSTDVAIIGGGIIGMSAAWRCAQRGLSVTVVDPDFDADDAPRGAWHTAAGMLAPVTELDFTETALLRLNTAACRLWPDFARELSRAAGLQTGFARSMTLQIAWDSADMDRLRDLAAFGTDLGLDFQMLTGRQLRATQSGLAPGLPGGLLARGDHQADPRQVHHALCTAAESAGVTCIRGTAGLVVDDDRVLGIRLEGGGDHIAAEHVVLAAGAWSGHIAGVESPPGVRPVKGQTVRVRLPGPSRLDYVVRARIKGNPVYVVPRADGEYVIGASVEETGFDQSPRTGAVYELMRDAISLIPELSESTFTEVCTGLRPGSPDNAPIVGPSGIEGLVYATGHFRNGVLLAPITATAVADIIESGAPADAMRPFHPSRLTEVTA